MDITLKNLRIQKKYLENINNLLQFEPYKNPQMEFLRASTRKLVRNIEKKRFKENNYDMFLNLFDMLENLDVINDDQYDYTQDHIDHSNFIKMFGAEASGPELRIYLESHGSNMRNACYKVYFDDNGTEISREPYNGL